MDRAYRTGSGSGGASGQGVNVKAWEQLGNTIDFANTGRLGYTKSILKILFLLQ